MAMQVASLFGVLTLDDTQFRRNLENARGGLSDLGGRMERIGGQVTRFGAGMTAATLPIAAGLGVAINSSREFDRTMSNVFAITGQTGTAAAGLRQQLLAFGGNTVAGPQRVAEAYYDIVSGVADASTHMAILENSVRTAEAGQADLTATTAAMIATMNAYGLQAEDAGWVSDIFSRTVGMGVLTMDELASALPQATGLAAQFGVGLDEAAGSMAYMTTQGFSASQSATYLRGMMTTLLNPTADLAEMITGLGYESGQAMLESEGLVGAYQLLAEQNGTLAGLITNQEALTGGLLLTKDAATEFLGSYIEGVEGATDAAGEIQDQTEGWALLSSKLGELAIVAGDQLAPVVLDLIDNAIIPAITAFTDWASANPETFNTLMMVMGGAVVLGPVITALGGIISGLGTVIGIANMALGGMPGRMLAAIGPIVAVGAAIAGVIAQIHEFNRLTNEAASNANQAIDPLLQSGQLTPEQLREESFRQTAAQFGGGIAGDIAARLLYENVARGAETGEFHLVDTRPRADGGPVTGGMPYMVGERGPELFVPGVSGSIVPNEAMGGVQIGNITINANDAAGGRAAADAFEQRLQEIRRRRG